MSRLSRLKTASHGDDGKWAYDEIVSLRKQRDELLSDLAEAKRSAEFNFEQYQDVGRLLHEECEKTEKLLAATEAIAINSEECLDFDECTAMLVSIDDYHKLMEAAARAKGKQ